MKMRHMDSLLTGLDTLLKHLPIPDEIQIDGKGFRWLSPTGRPFPKGFEKPKITERAGIVKFGEDVVIGRYECVLGDVVVFGGNATVYGEVQGGVVTVKGDVTLTSTANVEGDVVCIWGNADVAEGATTGQTTVLNFGRMFQKTFSRKPVVGWVVVFDLLWLFIVLAVAVLVIAAFPRQTKAVSARVQGQYARSLLVGILGILLIPVVFLVLLVTIIGIPVAVLGLPLALLAAFLMGGTAVGFRIGELLREQFHLNWSAPAALACTGILIIQGIVFFGRLANLADPSIGKVFFLLNLLIFICTWVPGYGAVLLTRFGTRPKAEPSAERKRPR
jgi:hypothetical protein